MSFGLLFINGKRTGHKALMQSGTVRLRIAAFQEHCSQLTGTVCLALLSLDVCADQLLQLWHLDYITSLVSCSTASSQVQDLQFVVFGGCQAQT